MKQIFADMRALYAARRLSGIDAFISKWIDDKCVLMGTALGELMKTPKDIRELFYSDLRYWYDIDILDGEATIEDFSDHVLLCCPALCSYTINENTDRYENYIVWCDETAQDTLATPTQKGAKIAFMLDTLLSSRKNKRRKNVLPLTIRVIMKNGKAVFISFAFDKTLDTAENYLLDSADTMTFYKRERDMLDGAVPSGVLEHINAEGYKNVKLESPDGRIFYGIGTLRKQETQDEATLAVLNGYKKSDAYDSLFSLRLRLAYLQSVYSLEAHPRAIVRFFGLCENDAVSLFVPVFPLSLYMECQ